MKRMLHVFIQALRLNASGFLSVFNPSSRRPALPAVFRATIFLAAFIPTGSALPAAGHTAAFNPVKNIITVITLGDSPVVCQGVTGADLPYTELNGSPLPDEYTIDYDAAAEAAGFADVAYTVLPLSPIPLVVPAGAAPAVYNATIRVRNALNDQSPAVAFTVTVVANPVVTLSSNLLPATAFCGDTLSITIEVENGFTDLAALQFSLSWNAAALIYIDYTTLNIGGGDPAIGDGNTVDGELTYSWLDPAGFDGEDLADGTVLLTVRFKVLVNSGTVAVNLTDVPLPLEASNSAFCSAPVTAQNGEGTTVLPDPPVVLSATGPAAAMCGDTLTVTITAEDGFTDLSALQYSLAWNNAELMYIDHNATQIGGAGGDPAIGDGNAGDGELTYSWLDGSGFDGEDLPDGSVLLTVRFKVLTNTANAAVDITGVPLPVEASNNSFCSVSVTTLNNVEIAITQGPGIVLSATSPADASCGDTVVVNITALSGFADISGLQYSINWDETQLMYLSHSALQIGGVGGDPAIGDGNVALGELTYSWLDGSGFDGEDLPDGTVLMSLSLKVISGTGPAMVDITGAPLPVEATNSSFCDEAVTLQNNVDISLTDTVPPVVTLLPPGVVAFNPAFVVSASPGACSQNVSWYRPSPLTHSATDNCSAVFVTEEQPIMPGGAVYAGNFFTDNSVTPYPYDYSNALHWVTPVSASFPIGTTLLRYYYSDASGNYDSVMISVTVLENQPPLPVCEPALTLPLDATGNAMLTAPMIDNGSTDNCGIDSFHVSPAAFTCATTGATVVTLTVTDFAGNTATCTSTVTVVDNLPPVVNCPDDLVASTDANACTATAANIPGLNLTEITPASAPLTGPGQYKDNCGVVSVTWSLSGVTTAGPFTVALPAANIIPGGQVFNKGVTFVTYTFKDAKGNSTSCSFDVTVEDQAPPSATCPPDITLTSNTGGCITQATWTPPTFSDNCPGNITVFSSHNPGAFFFYGTTTVTYTATDAAGNVGTCTFNVIVNDLQAPVAKCQDITVSLGADGTVTVSPAQVDNLSSDNCFYNYVTVDSVYNCTDMGANAYTLTIVDGGGNTASQTCTLTVADNTPGIKDPVVTNCADFTPPTVSLDANCQGTLDAAAYAANFTITDNTQNSAPSCPLTYDVDVDGSGFAPAYTWNCADAGANTVTFRVTDIFGNTAVCTKTMVVQDVTPPAIIDANIVAPPTVTVECSDYDPNDFTTLGQISPADVADACDDGCDLPIDISFFDVLQQGNCANEYTVVRTWEVADQAGNVTQHIQTFSVVDTEAPEFVNVQTLINLEANGQDEFPACVAEYTVALSDANIIDNCTASLLTLYDVFYQIQFPAGLPTPLLPGASVTQNFPVGTSVVTFTAVDPCGNSNQVAITIQVDDVSGPVIDEPFASSSPFFNNKKICDSTFTILNITGSCGNNFSWYRPFRADNNFLDCSGYEVTESISDASVQSAINVSTPFNYNTPPLFSVFPVGFFPVGTTTVTYTATDDAGNTTTCAFYVKVVDTQAPDINCPGNQTLSISSACNGSTTVPDYASGIQVTDNCLNNVVLTQTPAAGTLLAGVVNPVQAGQMFTIKIKATDSQPNNLMDSCTFTVTLFDGTAPVPVLPLLPAINSFCGKDTVDAPAATDCDGSLIDTIYGTPSVSVLGILPPLVPGGPPRYIITAGNYAITWSYTDPQNNTTTQLQSVNVFADNNPPVAQCKPPFTVNLTPAGDYALSISEIDNGSFDQSNCGPVMLSINPAVLTCANLNVPVNVVLTVKDVANNVAQCVVPVTVLDVTAPVLSPIPLSDTLEACTPVPAPPAITAVDVCDLNVTVTYKQDTVSFTNAYQYIARRMWTATDDSGNSSTGVQVLTVQDTQAPVFALNTPDSLVVFTDPDDLDCKDTVAINIKPFVSDCDSTLLLITNNRTGQGAQYSEILSPGTYFLTFTAKDGNNNSATKTIKLIVKDGTTPIAACINGVSVSLQASGTVTITPANVNAGSSDNCTPIANLNLRIQRLIPLGPITTSITFTCADADGVTHHPVKLYVRDAAGNESFCETYIVVQDNVFPVITSCPPDKTVQCTADFSPAVQGSATASDNCAVVSLDYSDSTAAGSGNICTVMYRTWKVQDLTGNMTTCVQVFSIQDTVKPVFTLLPNNLTVTCSDALVNPPAVDATDNCDADVDVTLQVDTINMAPGNCGLFSYTIRRTWTAVDNCGKTNVHTQQVVVTDLENPAFLGMPDTITVKSADYPVNPDCTVPVSLDVSQFLSDCQPDSLIQIANTAPHGNGGTDISGNYTTGQYQITFTATDACGNAGVDSITLIVIDNSVPTVVCNNNVVIALGTNGEGTIQPGDIDLNSTDNCGVDTMYLSQSTFDCQDLGQNAVTLTVVDVNGNSNFCTVNVTVTAGTTAGFTLVVSGTPESYSGAADGKANAVATGGSGQFTYTWSNGLTTASIDHLSAGVYTVTVEDSANGCQQIDTVVVEPGANIMLTAGSADGCAGQVVSLSVTVDNFIAVTGFSFTLHPMDPAVGALLGITAGSVNPAIASGLNANLLAGNNLGATWFGVPLTLPNGAVLFSIDVQLGAVAVGSTTPVLVTGVPVSLQFTQDSSGVSVVASVHIQDGSVGVVCDAGLDIGGDIETWRVPVKPVPGVDVSLTGGVTAGQTTGPPGTYLFSVPPSTNTTVQCHKETAGNAGITGSDILLIKRHVLNIQPLTSPYQFVAADVSNEGNLSILDYARIQEVALGTKMHINGAPDWKFIPKSYVFPAPNPISVKPDSTISHTPAAMSFPDDDFVAVRMGDVNGNIVPTFTSDNVYDRSAETLRFRLDDRSFRRGEMVEIAFKAADFTERSGYQMTILFDPNALELADVVPGTLPEMNETNFGKAYLAEGMLTTLWVSAEPLSTADGTTLFTLTFKALRNGTSLADVLHPGSDVTRAEAYNRDGQTTPIDFEFVRTGPEVTDFRLFQNRPNPFGDATSIAFRLPEPGRATLRVFNASGRLVKTVVGDFEKGYNEVTFTRSDLGSAGVYYYELSTPKYNDRKKMVLMD